MLNRPDHTRFVQALIDCITQLWCHLGSGCRFFHILGNGVCRSHLHRTECHEAEMIMIMIPPCWTVGWTTVHEQMIHIVAVGCFQTYTVSTNIHRFVQHTQHGMSCRILINSLEFGQPDSRTAGQPDSQTARQLEWPLFRPHFEALLSPTLFTASSG